MRQYGILSHFPFHWCLGVIMQPSCLKWTRWNAFFMLVLTIWSSQLCIVNQQVLWGLIVWWYNIINTASWWGRQGSDHSPLTGFFFGMRPMPEHRYITGGVSTVHEAMEPIHEDTLLFKCASSYFWMFGCWARLFCHDWFWQLVYPMLAPLRMTSIIAAAKALSGWVTIVRTLMDQHSMGWLGCDQTGWCMGWSQAEASRLPRMFPFVMNLVLPEQWVHQTSYVYIDLCVGWYKPLHARVWAVILGIGRVIILTKIRVELIVVSSGVHAVLDFLFTEVFLCWGLSLAVRFTESNTCAIFWWSVVVCMCLCVCYGPLERFTYYLGASEVITADPPL